MDEDPEVCIYLACNGRNCQDCLDAAASIDLEVAQMTAFPPDDSTASGPEGSGWIEDTRDTTSDAHRAAERDRLALSIAHPHADRAVTQPHPNWCTACRSALAVADDLIAAGWGRRPAPDQGLVDLIRSDYPVMAQQPMRAHAEAIAAAIQAAGWTRGGDERLARALDLLDRYSQADMGGTPDLFAPDCGHMATGTVTHDPWDCMEAQVAVLRGGEQS